jgi:hypothetical protein
VCKGNSYAYTVPAVSSATSYLWSYSGTGASIVGSGNSVTVSFSSTATNGSISVSAVNGCGTGAARTVMVTTVTPAVATFSYGGPYCPNAANPSPTFSGGGIAGTFSSTSGLVFVSTTTGEVNLAASTPGTYTITNTIAASAPCGAVSDSNPITILATGNWLGGVSSDWLDPNNWNCIIVPTSTSDVVIPNGAPFMPVVTGSGAVCRSININSGASLSINGSNNLDVYGSWTNDGSFTCNSSTVTFNGTGSIGGSAGSIFNDVLISASGNLTSTANLDVSGNWTSNGAFSASSGTVVFNGTSTRTITGTNSFYDLTMSKTSSDITLAGAGTTTVNNLLTLTTGNIITSSSHLLALSSAATISGGSANSFVSGPMRKTMNAATSFNYPLGSGTSLRYRPVAINNTSGNDSWTVEYFGTNPTNNGYSNQLFNNVNFGTISEYEYWTISRTGATTAGVTLSYAPGSYEPPNIGTVANLRVARWNGLLWDLPPGGGSHSQSGNNIIGTVSVSSVSDFSPFTLASTNFPSPLPVSWLEFKGERIGNTVELTWKTAQERNNDRFEIERSSNGKSFKKIGTVQGSGDSRFPVTYNYVDKELTLSVKYYYRIKQIDYDGIIDYSSVIVVFVDEISHNGTMWSVYPNPVTDGEFLKIYFLGFKPESVMLMSILTLQGSALTSYSGSLDEINLYLERYSERLPRGVYVMTLANGTSTQGVRIIKR